jgi:hypothetical protein
MLGLRLMRLVEAHSEELAAGLTEKLRKAERTCDFRRIPPEDLHRRAAEVYHNLGEWLLTKTEDDIEKRFKAIGAPGCRWSASAFSMNSFSCAWILPAKDPVELSSCKFPRESSRPLAWTARRSSLHRILTNKVKRRPRTFSGLVILTLLIFPMPLLVHGGSGNRSVSIWLDPSQPDRHSRPFDRR